MSVSARIVQISVSPGGIPKRPVASAQVTMMGVQSDVQRNRTHHGGLERALCLFSQDHIRVLHAEGHRIQPGSISENLTIEGIDWSQITPGVCLIRATAASTAGSCGKVRAGDPVELLAKDEGEVP